ncbi:serine/threonine protein kinase [Mycoplasmopsis verecunda]|uniref:Serine/threonine protein kinase n=1 Tax=Mycoplasmopsis verecunda TaxID=171291 RepID=A0A1T4KT32_9BACT|nr:serine/threonine-protein kinase [Mycoplasmopsis verecunda]WPB54662.1 serine/threonine-protein kinase [Mycoplasmopsis verecunda]SJZ45604.1 serine/threonine protein kinase [Mycoplasmopsis verecunda]
MSNNFSVPSSSKIHNKYIIKTILGSGGMGTVFLVTPKNNTNIKYALKFMSNVYDKVAYQRFKEEATLLGKVKSKHIPKLIDYYGDNVEQYYVMEYISGNTLYNIIRANGSLNVKKAKTYINKIAEGIGELHNNGVIHRDIKSQNIIIDDAHNVKIIDLGISLTPESQRLTKVNAVICSPYYAAPEYTIKGAEITKAVDIYALGVVLFEMLTGQYPFEGARDQDTIMMHYKNQFPSPKEFVDLPQAMCNVVIKATAKHPEDRYQNVYEFQQDLKTCLSPERIYEQPLNPKSLKKKRKISDIVNSNAFLITSLSFIVILIISISLTLVLLEYL